MTVQPGDILEVSSWTDYGGDAQYNIFHVRHNGANAVPDSNVVTQVGIWLNTAYATLLTRQSSLYDYNGYKVVNITQSLPVGNDAFPGITTGSDAVNQAYALQVAPLVRFTTLVLRSQGRKFIGGFTEGWIDGAGYLTTDAVTSLGLWAGVILSGFDVILEPFKPGNWNPTLGRFAQWQTAIINEFASTLRSRRFGVGS